MLRIIAILKKAISKSRVKITLYGIIHSTDIDALDVIPAKYQGGILYFGVGAGLQLIRINRTDYIKMELSYVQKGPPTKTASKP
ncbi:MAG TPA: hypothetical protein DDX39_05110 [Bacteroidales bacterium]|nr:MAG: hypothetical protein A2W98_11070 [Bacteroidetes bacterium GWF2_33_38]OFY91489.1 MAG: hypothetical protein A2236_05085 [Bacteroidetes bacterium RIFOXYA2_FULL_33_7]HBF88005.1 hypothetical protein [Bacteroidales bacterium]